jgi:hypothetical protein
MWHAIVLIVLFIALFKAVRWDRKRSNIAKQAQRKADLEISLTAQKMKTKNDSLASKLDDEEV